MMYNEKSFNSYAIVTYKLYTYVFYLKKKNGQNENTKVKVLIFFVTSFFDSIT